MTIEEIAREVAEAFDRMPVGNYYLPADLSVLLRKLSKKYRPRSVTPKPATRAIKD